MYGHQGNGGILFARYDVALDQWTLLPPVPAGAVLGASIDPMLREYVAYGPYFGQNVYRYSIAAGSWSVATNPFFPVGDGGLGWLRSLGNA